MGKPKLRQQNQADKKNGLTKKYLTQLEQPILTKNSLVNHNNSHDQPQLF